MPTRDEITISELEERIRELEKEVELKDQYFEALEDIETKAREALK